MWARNLIFLALCVLVALAFLGSVFPAPKSLPAAVTPPVPDLTSMVAKIDAALRDDWQQHNLRPAPRAPDLLVARRLSLALTGTIPSLEEIRRFEAQPADQRIDGWLDGILADRRYADFVAERLARAYVGVEDGPVLLFRRRRFVSWLADQLSENQPYDVMVRHLISDSGLWTDQPATNFITVAIDQDNDADPDAKVLASRVSRAFLGVRIDCAECHDHPFEPWKQSDFNSLAAYFGQTKSGFKGISDGGGEFKAEDKKLGKEVVFKPHVPYQAELLPGKGSRRAQLAAWVTHRENQAFARATVNRAWAIMFGRPLIEPVDNIPLTGAPPVLELLADDFAEHDYDWQRLLRTIAATQAFRIDSKVDSEQPGNEITSEHNAHWAAFPLTRLRPEQVIGALLQSASLSTIDYQSHILVRIARQGGQTEFVNRYGDSGAEEFELHGGTVPQRLLMMNGEIVKEKTSDNIVLNASTRIAALAPTDEKAVETAMLAVLTRRPTREEQSYFAAKLARLESKQRNNQMEDFYWTLLNSTEFAWNH